MTACPEEGRSCVTCRSVLADGNGALRCSLVLGKFEPVYGRGFVACADARAVGGKCGPEGGMWSREVPRPIAADAMTLPVHGDRPMPWTGCFVILLLVGVGLVIGLFC